MAKTERIEARLSADERRLIHRAAHMTGRSASSFVVAAAVEKADQLIAEQAATVVPPDFFDRLGAALDRADPAARLARAAERARQRRRIG